MTIALRNYQKEAIASIHRDWDAGYPDVLLTMATGGGKTAVFLSLLDQVLTDGKRALVLAHRKELIEQPLERLHQYYPHWMGRAGIVMAKRDEPSHQLVIATVQTLASPSRLDGILEHGPIDYLVTDEAHHATAQTYLDIYDRLRDANPGMRHLGVTATPIRADGAGLRQVFKKESAHYGIVELIKAGHLAPVRWLAIQTTVSLEGIASRQGDFVVKQLKDVFETDNCYELVVESHKKYATGRQAVAFTVTVEGAYKLAEKFREAGIKASAADGTTNKKERSQILANFAGGKTDVLCNVGLYTEGLDVPQASCIHQVRPTRSDGLYTQMIGRGLRTFPGKQDCIAEGQLVLTDNGLIPIEKVTKEMRVWDGESFVNHAGAICKGYQEVITYAGLTATPDHKVWTKYGWRQFGECARNRTAIAVTGDGGAAIREIDGYQRNTCVQQQVLQTKRRVWDILSAGPLHRFTVEGLLVSNCLVLDYAPIEVRNIAMMGDVLGVPLRKDSYVEEKTEQGEVIGGFTFDGKFSYLAGNPAEIISRQLDYLELSPWSWHRQDGWLSLGLGSQPVDPDNTIDRTLVITPPADGQVRLYVVAKWAGGRWQPYELGAGDFDDISALAEELISKHGNATLAARNRSWRRQPPTDKQIAFARRLKGAFRPGLSKGELAQSITHHLAVQQVEKVHMIGT